MASEDSFLGSRDRTAERSIDRHERADVSSTPAATVSAVVPVFDEGGGSLARTLHGLRSQSLRLEHLVVVDDASSRPVVPDGSGDPDVEVVRLAKNGGLSNARNHGARLTTSDYVLFVNCDVVLAADWVSRAVEFMEAKPDVGAVSGIIRPVVGPQVLRDWRLHVIEPKVHRSTLTEPTEVTWLVGHVSLVRRTVFEQVGRFDCRFRSAGEDWDFSQRVRGHGYSVVHLPTLVADSHEVASIDGLARKRIRNAGWSLLPRPPEHACAATRPLRPLAAAASVVRFGAEQLGRDILRRRIRFLPVDVVITAHSLILILRGARGRQDRSSSP